MSEFNAVAETQTVKPTGGDQFPEYFTRQILDCLNRGDITPANPRADREWNGVLKLVSQAVEEAERRGQPSQKDLFVKVRISPDFTSVEDTLYTSHYTKRVFDAVNRGDIHEAHPNQFDMWNRVFQIVRQVIRESELRGPNGTPAQHGWRRKPATHWMQELSKKTTKGRITVPFVLDYEKVFLEIIELAQADVLGEPPASQSISPLEHEFRTKKDLGQGELIRLIRILQAERDAMCDNWKLTHKAYLRWDAELQVMHGKDVHKALADADKELFILTKQLEDAVVERDKNSIAVQQSAIAQVRLTNEVDDLRMALATSLKQFTDAASQVVALKEQAQKLAISTGEVREECGCLMRQLLKTQNEERRLEHACTFYRERHDLLAERIMIINKFWLIVFARKIKKWWDYIFRADTDDGN